jgi:hypothetical protein
MVAKNDVTGDTIASKYNSQKYVDNWDSIFNKKKDEEKEENSQKEVDSSDQTN